MTWCSVDNAVPAFVLASSAIRCRFVDRFVEPKVSSRVSWQRFSSPWRLPSLARVPVSPVPRGQQYDEGATTSRLRIPGHLFVSLPGPTRFSVVRARFGSAPGRVEHPIQARAFVQPAAQLAGVFSHGRKRDLTGSQAIHPMPLPRSKTPAGSTIPHHDGVVDAAPALPTAKAPAIIISRLLTRLQHLLPTLQEWRCRHPGKARFRLAGWPLPGES